MNNSKLIIKSEWIETPDLALINHIQQIRIRDINVVSSRKASHNNEKSWIQLHAGGSIVSPIEYTYSENDIFDRDMERITKLLGL